MIRSTHGNVRFRNLMFVFLFVFSPFILFAQEALAGDAEVPADSPETELLTIEKAVEMAIENNLSLQVEGINLGTKKRSSDFSWNQFIPTVGVRGTFGVLNEKPKGQEFPLPPPIGTVSMPARPQGVLTADLSASLNFNVAMIERMNNLKLEYQGGLVTYDNAKKQLEKDVRKSYNNILLMEANITLLKESLSSAEQQVAMTRANYNAGLVPELTLLQAQVAMENLKPAILEMENGLSVMQSSFAFTLGLPFGAVIALTPIEAPDYIDLNLEELINKASNVKPEIIALKQTLAVMKSNKKSLQFRDFTPSLSLNWNAGPTFTADPLKDPWFGDADDWSDSQGMFSVTIAMNLHSLLPFSAAGLERKALDDGIDTLNLSLAQLVRGTEIEVYQTVLLLEKSRTNMEALQLTENMALRSYQLTQQAYRNGLAELLEVQSALIEYQKAQNEVLKENFNYLSGLIDLEYAIGVPFGTLSGER